MVLVQGTSSECALRIYEVSLKYLYGLSSYRADTILWRTDRWTQGEKQYVSQTFQVGGGGGGGRDINMK